MLDIEYKSLGSLLPAIAWGAIEDENKRARARQVDKREETWTEGKEDSEKQVKTYLNSENYES